MACNKNGNDETVATLTDRPTINQKLILLSSGTSALDTDWSQTV